MARFRIWSIRETVFDRLGWHRRRWYVADRQAVDIYGPFRSWTEAIDFTRVKQWT